MISEVNVMTKSIPGVVLNLDGIELSKSELIDYIRDADGLILGFEEVDLFNSNAVHKVVVS